MRTLRFIAEAVAAFLVLAALLWLALYAPYIVGGAL
jgi:hypothetical protein